MRDKHILEVFLILVVLSCGVFVISWSYTPVAPTLGVKKFEDARRGSVLIPDPDCQNDVISKLKATDASARRLKCSEEAESQRIATNDLIQQTRAADAGEAQVLLAYQANRLAFIQTIAGFVTLIAAGVAAFHAKRASDAAKDSLEDQRKSAAETERPWLSVELLPDADITLNGGEGKLHFEVKITNLGKRVATNVSAWTMLYQGAGLDDFGAAKKQAENAVSRIKVFEVDNIRTVLPGRNICIRQSPKITISGGAYVRAFVAVRYAFVDGGQGYTWEVFKVETLDNGCVRSIARADKSIKKEDTIVRSVGWTHSI